MRKALLSIAALAAAGGMATTAQAASLFDNFGITIEGAGVQNSATVFDYKRVVTFDGLATGAQPAPYTASITSTQISATYNNLNVVSADQYGGAGGTGNYAAAGLNKSASYSISFNNAAPSAVGSGVNYFGFWLSALDKGNQIEFFNGGASLGTFSPTDVLSLVGGSGSYYGNPNAPFLGNNAAEPYVFINFFLTDAASSFDKIVITQSGGSNGAGYETDNHTFGSWKTVSGTPVSPVPEPATWMMMISGCAMVGGALRFSNARTKPNARTKQRLAKA